MGYETVRNFGYFGSFIFPEGDCETEVNRRNNKTKDAVKKTQRYEVTEVK